MTDPLRSDHGPEQGDVPERDRDARVEGLLLTGLDHYFAGQHELAISVWTRVLFLDRGHARAKAYIERARSAIAERQREGEELLHIGAAAFDRGDARAARRLLNSAVERGAGSEEALALLERLNRLEQARPHPVRSVAFNRTAETPTDAGAVATDRTGSSRIVWIATGVLAGLAASGIVAWFWLTRPGWLSMNGATVVPPAAVLNEPLPVPSPSETWLSRAKALFGDGRLRDALDVLDAIGPADPLKGEADELRTAIQRKLLEAGRVRPPLPSARPVPRESRPRPDPSSPLLPPSQ